MNELLQTMIGQGIVGQVLKHVIPWDGINKLIPIFNIAAGTAYGVAQGLDWGTAATYGIVGQLGTQNVKTKVGDTGFMQGKQFHGLGVQNKRISFVKRAF